MYHFFYVKIMSNFTLFKYAIFSIVLGIVLNGLVFAKLWEWFIIPVFNIHPITIIQSIGIMTIFTFLNYKYDDNDKNETKSGDELTDEEKRDLLLKLYGRILGKALGTLFFGWIITLFM